MKTSITARILSDKSETYQVVFIDGSDKVIIECRSEQAAERLQDAFSQNACYATVETSPRRQS